MTKDVLISISGAHVVEEDTDDIAVITTGSYYYKNDRHYVLYEEVLDGVEGVIKNMIKIGPNTVDVIKNGGAHSHMVFEKDKTNMSCYATPYGQVMIGVNTSSIVVNKSEDELAVEIDYTLDVNYEKLSNCRIVMDIRSRATADLHLQS